MNRKILSKSDIQLIYNNIMRKLSSIAAENPEEIAEKAGVMPGTIDKLLKGDARKVPFESIVAIGFAAGYTSENIWKFFLPVDFVPSTDEEVLNFIDEFIKTKEDSQAHLEDVKSAIMSVFKMDENWVNAKLVSLLSAGMIQMVDGFMVVI